MEITTARKSRPTSEAPSGWQLQKALEALLAVRAELAAIDPTIEDDETLYGDMLEGEASDAIAVIVATIRSSCADDRHAEAAKAHKADIAARQARFERARDIKRRAAFAAFDILNLPKITEHDFTAYRHKGVPHVVITNIDANDLQPFVKIEKTPDKLAIKALLKLGERLDGAELSNPEPGLSVRVR